ncbi:MAG: gamma-glutamyltransferase [Bacteroidetes bacterium]|nr:MAG: gamma-glutamyltransferase [Bacteroidota bacterium]
MVQFACQNKQADTEENKDDSMNTNISEATFAKNGMVSSAHPLASAVGAQILKNGGNAADASVATFFALAVVYPRAGNIAGGGFAVCRLQDGSVTSLDFREKAASAATREMYLDSKGEVVAGLSIRGHLAAGVPGSVDGMIELHKKYGKMSWKDLIQPAVDLAKNGFKLTSDEAKVLNRFQKEFKEHNRFELHLVKNQVWQEGETITYPELAQTLERIRDQGRAGFYEGKTADLIVEEMKAGKGIISAEDLKKYHSVWRQPIIFPYKEYKVITMPPPSGGGIALAQLLMGMENYPFKDWGFNQIQSTHVMIEMERRAYADRSSYLGDPDFVKIPTDMLMNKEYIEKRLESISMTEKTPSDEIKEGKVDLIESVETTHFSVADKDGNAFSITTTLNSYFGCKVMVKGGGFFLNNEMDDFSVKPGVPNQFGIVGDEANAIAANKRMLSSMTPTILEKNGKLFMVVGTPGGSTIITTVYQVITNVIEHGMTLQQAISAKKFHHQWLPDEVIFEENTFDPAVLKQLEQMGHLMKPRKEKIGRVDAILVLPDGSYEGASDPRSEGKAIGY